MSRSKTILGSLQQLSLAGVITSIISESESEKLKAVAKELDLKLIEETALEAKAVPDPEADVDAAKKELEDLYNLL